METPQARNVAEVRRITWIGLIVNVLLSAAKLAAGIVGRSQVVVADAVHSLSDTMSDVAILVGIRYWSAPADEDHPYGHGRIETAVTVLIGLLLAGVAAGLIGNALLTLSRAHPSRTGIVAFWAALASVIIKEALYRWTARVGRRVNSPALVANAWHHRSDALSSIPAALAAGAAALSPQWGFLDHVGAVVVSVFIFRAAWDITRPAMNQLIDAGASAKDIEKIYRLAGAVDEVKEVHAVRTRHIGSGFQVDLHVLVDGTLTVQRGHQIAGTVKARLLKGADVVDVVVHIEPWGPDTSRGEPVAE